VDTSWLASLTTGAQGLTNLGTAVNGDVSAATGWKSLLGVGGPANPAPPAPAPNGTLPPPSLLTSAAATASKYTTVLIAGALALVVLLVLSVKGR
jgi:hypothetical protein